MTFKNLSAPHWSYFKMLCDDVEKLGRFIELTPGNYQTYSIEIVRLLFAVCSEIDVVLKLLCAKIAPEQKIKDINDYCVIVTGKYPLFTRTVIEVSSLSLEFTPWSGWAVKNAPAWWQANNRVKHERNDFFHAANVGNLLGALAGLCVVLCYYQQLELNEPRRVWPSEFMELKNAPFYRIISAHGLGIGEAKLEHFFHDLAIQEGNRVITEMVVPARTGSCP